MCKFAVTWKYLIINQWDKTYKQLLIQIIAVINTFKYTNVRKRVSWIIILYLWIQVEHDLTNGRNKFSFYVHLFYPLTQINIKEIWYFDPIRLRNVHVVVDLTPKAML